MSEVSIAEATLEATRDLRRAGVPESRREAASLLAHALMRDRTFLITHAEEKVSAEALERFRSLVERRARGEPLQYITGHTEFFKLDFEVTPDVLIPRPETELLVETALGLLKTTAAPLVCDVGTGSGCIIISILHERAEARGFGLDISKGALAVARRNASRHGVEERLSLILSDCFEALDESQPLFDMIVSNPPYVAEDALEGLQREVRDFEPRVALTPGGDGLKIISRLLLDAPALLQTGGHLLLEIGFDQHKRVEKLIDPQTWELLNIHTDLQGIPRTVALRKR
ncbi:MAG: peptide chain release factor N(5)-glutamine methyltransferase [Pyrinomonadaceae bacterium]|nr:peptide chain release factor N(5)-glutamine methyltransferase [Pyrinomonadaceae bacterium]